MNDVSGKGQILRKGYCPTLSRPMETGDGLLVRLHIKYGVLSSDKARIVAACARKYGNGHIDLTSRGNLQFRGVTPEGYKALVSELMETGFSDEPRPERAANPQYSPPLGFLPTSIFSPPLEGGALLGKLSPVLPLTLPLKGGGNYGTIGLGLSFGRLEVDTLNWLADMAGKYGNGTVFLSAWRVVFVPNVASSDAEAIIQQAKHNGFIVDNHDPLRTIHTCPGAPACSSAQGKTRELALAIAEKIMPGKTVHVSGCAKGCACAEKSHVVITATQNGYDIAFDETAGATPVYAALNVQEVLNIVGTL